MKRFSLFFLLTLPFVCFSQIENTSTERDNFGGGSVGGGLRYAAHIFPSSVPSFPSPNAQAFQIFGNIPVSKFTGVPEIHIPLYEIVYGDIVLPISLRYHTANRRVHSMPSWVGLGWNLDVGGVITRNMRGGRDESNRDAQRQGMPPSYFGYMHNWRLWHEGRDHRFEGNIWDIRFWDCNFPSSISILQDGQGLVTRLDHLPDEFSFNFMGYSGTFFWDIRNGFVVNSEHAIRVEFNFNDDVVPTEVVNSTLSGQTAGTAHGPSGDSYISRFRLITPDGMIYTFGSRGNLDGVEISAPRQNAYNHDITTSSWFLTQITSPNGFQINLRYQRGPVIANLHPHYEGQSYNFAEVGSVIDDRCPLNQYRNFICQKQESGRTIKGQVIFPVYLQEITFSTGRVLFARSNSNAKRYSRETLNAETFRDVQFFNHISFGDLYGRAIWQKLDAITVFNEANRPFKRFNFSYIENPNERLKLRSVQEHALNPSGQIIASKPPYTFYYNSNRLPGLDFRNQHIADRSDHWGFPNDNWDNSNPGLGENFYRRRQPSNIPSTFLAEILERIVWPTGGYTRFEFEPHRYSKRVSLDRRSLEECAFGNCLAGGVRIRRITSVDRANQQNTRVKEFLYEIQRPAFLGRAYAIQLSASSGILATQPFYFYHAQGIRFPHPNRMFNSSMLLPIGEAAFGSHIGYSVVYKKERVLGPNDQPGETVSLTRSRFTNFDSGNEYLDGGIPGVIGGMVSTLNNGMFIVDSRAHRRGRLIEETLFANLEGWRPVRRTQIQHTAKNIAPPNTQLSFHAFYFSPACNFRGYKIDQQTQVWKRLEVYLPTSKTITYYKRGAHGTDTLTTRIFYAYTDILNYRNIRLLRSKTAINSEGETIRTEFFYPHDFRNAVGNNHPIREMIRRNMINQPIEIRTSVNNRVVSGAVRTVGLFNGNLLLPSADYVLELNAPIPNPSGQSFFPTNPNYRRVLTYTSYDSRGNLLSFTDRSGVSHSLLWGYRQTRPIAHIQNATWTQVSNALGGNLSTLAGSTNDVQIRNILATLRNHDAMRNTHVHSFTYQFPFGISSITGPSGITIFHEFDGFGRLTTTRDHKMQILERIIYNYRTR